MLESLIAGGWYMLIFGSAILFQRVLEYTYTNNTVFFAVWYGVFGIGGLIFMSDLVTFDLLTNVPGMGVVVLMSIGFLIFVNWWRNKVRLEDYWGYEYLPRVRSEALLPTPQFALVKIIEVFLSQLILVIFTIEQMQRETSILMVSLYIAIFMAILHAPSPFTNGRYLGTAYLVLSSSLMPLLPFFLLYFAFGFYFAVACHILVYPLIMIGFYLPKNMRLW